MTRYKLRVPEAGTDLVGDGPAVVADSIEEAREFLEDFEVHPSIGWCHVLTKREVEDGDGFEGCEPGDTMVDYCRFADRELEDNECLVWQTGPPPVGFEYIKPLPLDPIKAEDIPIGANVYLSDPERSRSARTTSEARKEDGVWVFDVETTTRPFEQSTVPIGAESTHVLPSNDWPIYRYELSIQGQTAQGTEEEMNDLLHWATRELNEKWRRELHAAEAVAAE